MANKTSQHILGTAANLLGFCLFIITSLHLTDKAEISLVVEFTSLVALIPIASSVLSFVSIRTESPKRESNYERVTEYMFLLALIGIFAIIIFLVFAFWNKTGR